MVCALRYADEWHTAAVPLRWHGWPAPSGFSGSDAHPLHKCASPTAGWINNNPTKEEELPRVVGFTEGAPPP